MRRSRLVWVLLTSLLGLAGCGKGGGTEKAEAGKSAAAEESKDAPAPSAEAKVEEDAPAAAPAVAPEGNMGKFTGTIGEDKVELDVTCRFLDQPHFTFKSDTFDHKDSNGDGLVIAGMEHKGKLAFTYIVQDQTFSTGNLATFTKGDKKAAGEGEVVTEDASQRRAVKFEVTCP